MLIQGLTTLPREYVRRVIVAADISVIFLSVILSFVMQDSAAWTALFSGNVAFLLPFTLLYGAACVTMFGLHRIKLVMFNAADLTKIGMATVCAALGFGLFAFVVDVPHAISKALIFAVCLFAGSVIVRVLAIVLLSQARDRRNDRQPVAIFGAGGAGIQLASALRQSTEMRPVHFFDDNPYLHGMAIGGVQVHSSQSMMKMLRKSGISTVLIALPETAQERRAAVIEILEKGGIEVRVLPSFVDLLVGRGNEALFRTVSPDEILGRDTVELDAPEVAKSYAGRVVMVTGAGGSIGSELCRQLLNCRPARIVLFEQSEFNLYAVDQDLRSKADLRNVEVVSCLGSVTDPVRVRQVMADHGVEIVLHAAAYKHVPIVEENELEGARNNVIGTKVVADAAIEANLERFILVSTDKAVRPTNIMGATKRMSELVVQDIQTRAPNTKFSMVRFGNVLGSSGSVLPLFQAQIEAGGPVTVTHQEVTRFFMTISEATRLVLLAGAYAEGGDVFVLDMGTPQKIMDIAKRMIELSGRTVKDGFGGDIEIQVTGLRPGEKLYEELLLDHDCLCATPHAKILRAEETMLSEPEVKAMLRELNVAIKTANAAHLRKVIGERVDGYHVPDTDQMDDAPLYSKSA